MIFPIIGKFTRTTNVFLPAYFPGGMAPTTTTSEVESTQHVGHQPPFVPTQTLGSMDTGCESYPVATQT